VYELTRASVRRSSVKRYRHTHTSIITTQRNAAWLRTAMLWVFVSTGAEANNH